METPWYEYLTVAASMTFTLAIGLYFSRKGNRSIQEYMLGNRRMSVLPITLSMAATYLTGNSLMSSAQEIYLYGMQPIMIVVVHSMNAFFAWLYLPVIRSIESASIFEFFDRRFNSHVRKYASFIYALEMIHHTAMSQYIPALALSQATGFPPFPITCVLSLVCLLYTTTGGLKAVAWADTCQAFIFTSCTFALLFVGISLAGGPSEIWRKGVEGYRMEFFNLDPSPYLKYSIMNICVGGLFFATNFPLTPSFYQRVTSLPTETQIKRVIIYSSLFSAAFFFLSFTMGIIVYAYFAGCDPLLAGQIRSHAKILPYFVSRISKTVPGILGIFLAAVIAIALSTTTSCWNTVACTIYEDFFRPKLINNSKKTAFRILTAIVLVFSVASTLAVLLVQNLGSLLEATLTLKAVTLATNFILYHSGMFLPWVTTKGVIAGCISSTALTAYIIIGAQLMRKQNLVAKMPKILTTNACHFLNDTALQNVNGTLQIGSVGYGLVTAADPEVPGIFKISMLMYNLPGSVLGLLVSVMVSLVTGPQDLTKLDRKMINPLMHWALPPEQSTEKKGIQDNSDVKHCYTLVPQSDAPTKEQLDL